MFGASSDARIEVAQVGPVITISGMLHMLMRTEVCKEKITPQSDLDMKHVAYQHPCMCPFASTPICPFLISLSIKVDVPHIESTNTRSVPNVSLSHINLHVGDLLTIYRQHSSTERAY